MAHTSMSAFGSRENIEKAKESSAIDAYDILYLDDKVIGWIDKNGETVISTTRTQEDIFVNGVDGLGVNNGNVIPTGTSVDEAIKSIVRKKIPATYTKPELSLCSNNYLKFPAAVGYRSLGTNVETGTSLTPRLDARFKRNDAGEVADISIMQDGVIIANGSTQNLEYVGEEVVAKDGMNTVFSASAIYNDAPIKTDNLGGESLENWFAGGDVASSDFFVNGARRLFCGAGAGGLPELTSDTIRNMRDYTCLCIDENKHYEFCAMIETGQQYAIVAHPARVGDIKSITHLGNIDMLQNFDKTTIDVADARGGNNGMAPYIVYTYHMKIPAVAPVEFNVII